MKVLEKLRGDEDQDVRYFAGAKSFEEVSLFSDDATKNDGQSSEEFDDDSHSERGEIEERVPLASNTEDHVLLASLSSRDAKADDAHETSNITDEKLEDEVEKIREELNNVDVRSDTQSADEKSSSEDSSTVVVEEVLSNLIDTIDTK